MRMIIYTNQCKGRITNGTLYSRLAEKIMYMYY